MGWSRLGRVDELSVRDTRRAEVVESRQELARRERCEEVLRRADATCLWPLAAGSHALVGRATLTVAHVGDSRAYLLRDGGLTQLTEDHSLVSAFLANGTLDAAAARRHLMRSVIVRAVGLDASVRPDILTIPARTDDLLLLCSDGLSDVLEGSAFDRLVRAEPDLGRLVDQLVAAARERGAGDDVTVVAALLG